MRIWKEPIPLDEYHRDINGYIRGDRPCTRLLIHFVFTFKYRRDLSNYEGLLASLDFWIRDICKNKLWYLERLSVETNHIHILIQIPPSVSISYVAQIIKTNASRLIRQEYPQLIEDLHKTSLFGRKYFAKTVGDNDFKTTVRYIENQGVVD